MHHSLIHNPLFYSKTLRGSGGDVLWLEEAAFMPPSLFFEVVLPLLEVEKTSMLAISTPSDEGEMNFYTSMMGTKDPNDPSKLMFKVLKISLACPACTEAGRASECTHSKYIRYISVTFFARWFETKHYIFILFFLCIQWKSSDRLGRVLQSTRW